MFLNIKNRIIFRIKDDSGVVAVIVALAMIVLIGFVAYVTDIGSLAKTKSQLQSAVDAAALAGAQNLPNTTTATAAANEYIELNGFSSSNISIDFSESNTVITVSGTEEVPYIFAQVLGSESSNVTAIAAAQKVGLGAAFGFTLFSGSTNTTLILNGSNQYVGGGSHTNKNFIANGSSITITGVCEACTTITINGSNINIPNRYPNSSYVEMPDFSETIRLQAEAAGTMYSGNKTYNGSSMNVDNPIYINGNLTVNGSHFVGKGCVLVTGNITFNGSNLNQSTTDAVCFYSKNGNIIVNGSSARFQGILYAPNGSITMNGSNQRVDGRVIGNTITINGSGLTFQGGSNELNSLPTSIMLIR